MKYISNYITLVIKTPTGRNRIIWNYSGDVFNVEVTYIRDVFNQAFS